MARRKRQYKRNAQYPTGKPRFTAEKAAAIAESLRSPQLSRPPHRDINFSMMVEKVRRSVELNDSWDRLLEWVPDMAAEVRLWYLSYQGDDGWFWWFQRDWKMLRGFLPLQLRLFVEQLFYDEGMPWRGLVTGFGPVVSVARPR